MPAERPPAWRRLLSSFALFAALGVLAAALFIWSGIYPVGADRDHFGFTTWLLERARWQSVDTYSSGIEAPPLDNPDLVILGAGHFHGGGMFCHGAPGILHECQAWHATVDREAVGAVHLRGSQQLDGYVW